MSALNRAQQILGVIWLSVQAVLVAIIVTPSIANDVSIPSSAVKALVTLSGVALLWCLLGFLILEGWDRPELELDYEDEPEDQPVPSSR